MKAMRYVTTISAIILITGLSYAGTITGKITYDGDVPARSMLKATKDQHCIDAVKGTKSEALVVSKGTGIKNVVVYLRSRKAKVTPPAKNPVMDQMNCAYSPHVLAVVAGTTVDIRSSDPVAHNVHSHAKKDPEAAVNWQIAQQGKVFPLTLKKAEPIKFTCDIHNWMTGYIVVVENDHFAVTGDKDKDGKWISSDAYEKSSDAGTYTIANVPAGKYRIQVWHEELGLANRTVTVTDSGEVEESFTSSDFKKKKAK
ncbi:hypothetical protein IIA15_03675 [candidate division TA06 bacterium]|nr:hypothetical protein [candidate division TA06 bacterium]